MSVTKRVTKLSAGILLLGLAVVGTSAADEDDCDEKKKVEVEAAVAGLSGECPNLHFSLVGVAVSTDSDTLYQAEGCCGVVEGKKIEVKGTVAADGSIRARKIEFD